MQMNRCTVLVALSDICLAQKRLLFKDAIISHYHYISGLAKTRKRATNKTISDKNHGNSKRNANT